MNRKGGFFDLFVLIIIGFVAVLFFVVWTYGHNMLTDQLVETGLANPDTPIANATAATFSQIDAALPGLRWVAFGIIFGMILAILISNFLVKAHPVFLIPYFLFTIIAIIFSVFVSNAYEDLMTDATIGTILQTYTASNFVMLHLPIWITIIGIAGAILLFIGVSVDREQGGSLI